MSSKMIITKIKNWYKNDKKIILSSLLIGVSVAILTAFATADYSENLQNGIAEEIIRFHVLANSDSESDQELKLKVRDGIIDDLRSVLGEDSEQMLTLDETRSTLCSNLDRIIECAENIINENGYDYTVTAQITTDMFPTKKYADVSFPAGQYEALRVVIGSGEGKNWWCVMFPPLCFVDITQKELPEQSKEQLQNILTEEEYNVVLQAKDDNELPYAVRFKIVELWQKVKNCFAG